MALRFKSVDLVCSLSEDLPQAVFIFDIFKLASLAKETVRDVSWDNIEILFKSFICTVKFPKQYTKLHYFYVKRSN